MIKLKTAYIIKNESMYWKEDILMRESRRMKCMKKKWMALVLSGVLFLQSAGMAYGAEFSDGVGVEICNDFEKQNEKETSEENTPEANDISEGFSDNNEITEEDQFSGGLEEEQNSQEKELDEENDAVSATASQTSGTCGKNLKWEFKNGTLTIWGDEYMSSTPWLDFVDNIKKIVIKQGVRNIERYAFYECSGLTSVTIPNSVTWVGDDAFSRCSGLTSVTIPNSVMWIGDDAFSRCSGLTSVTIPSSVTSIGRYAFYECSGLISVTIPSSVTGINYNAFSGCSGLTSVTIPNSVTWIGTDAFSGCSGLTSVTIPNSVKRIVYNAFSGCSGLISVTIPSSVTTIERDTFSGCSGLTSVTIPSSVTTIERDAFYECSGLTDVYYKGSETEWKKINIGSNNGALENAKIHYNSSAPSSDKKFSLTISKPPLILGNYNSLFIDYEASVAGNAASKVKQIKWESSDPSVAEVDEKSVGLITGQGNSSGCSWIDLLTYNAGKTVITGTAPDGRKASVEVEIEPKLSTEGCSGSITKESLVTLCTVTLKKANKKYLESFMENLKVTPEAGVKVRDTSYTIAKDGKSAKFTSYVNLIGMENAYVKCTSQGGQSVKLLICWESTVDILTSDYNYEAVLKKWMNDEGTQNSINYLTGNKNYVNTLMVAQSEKSYLGELVENTSNLVFGGFGGWKNYWTGSTKKEEARKILAGLLTVYSDEVESLSIAETANELSDAFLSALKNANWAYAIKYGLSSKEIEELSKLCTKDHIENFFFESKYTELSKYLARVGGYGEDSKIIKCIRAFSKSDEAIKTVSKKLEFLGNGLTALKLCDSTIKRYYELETLSRADQRYCEILLYLKQNCSYVPVQQAAADLYAVINDELGAQQEYLLKEITDEITEKAVNKILDTAISRVPMSAVIYNSYKYSVGFANLLFHTADAQKQKDNMTCAAYIGTYLSEWLNANKATYLSSYGNTKNEAAQKTVFAYYMLLKTRMTGEESCRKFMELIKYKKGSRQYNVSLEITSTLESMEKLLKSNGALMNRYLSSVVACPVDVTVCNASGSPVLTVRDGQESSGTVNGIYYNVYYNPLEQDYAKIINLPSSGGYTLKCTGNDLGKVYYSVSSISADGSLTRKEADEIPVKKGSQIQIDNISSQTPICKLEDKDGSKKEYPVQDEKKDYVAVSSLKTDKTEVVISTGEKEIITLSIAPENATNKGVEWASKNPDIATVNADGVITGISAGTTTVRATTVETSGVYADITIKVTDNTGKPATPTPAPSKPAMPQIVSVSESYNAFTFKWDAVSDANGYQIYRKVNSGKWKPLKTTTKTSYKDKAVKAGYKYSYTVKAYRTENSKKIFSEYNKKGLSGKLNTSISLAAKNKTVVISWKKTTGAAGYYVYRSENKTGKFSRIKTTSARTLKYTDTKVKDGGTYNYKVVPFGKVNNKNVSGSSSAVKTVTLSKKQTANGSGYKFIEGINKIIPLLEEEQLSGDKYYTKTYHIDDDADKQKVVSFQYRKGEQGTNYFSIVCQPDVSHNGGYIVLTWHEGETKPLLDVYYVKDSDYNVNGYLSYQKKGNDYILDFTKNSTLKFKFTPKSKSDKYTLTQLNTMANETFHEVLQMLDSCMKQNMNMSIKDLGFKNY